MAAEPEAEPEAEEPTPEVVSTTDSTSSGVPESILVGDNTYYRDPYAEVHNGEIYTRDSTAYQGGDGQVYVWNPFAFIDPRTGNAYSLEADVVVK